MGGGGEGGGGTTLEFTPTWVVVAGVCTVSVGISLAVERLLHFTGKYLKRKNQKPLFDALQKVKEELMVLGFISLLLTVFQGSIIKICVNQRITHHLLPCKLPSQSSSHQGDSCSNTTELLPIIAVCSLNNYPGPITVLRRYVFGSTGKTPLQKIIMIQNKNKVPLLSVEALHHLHIFMFVLAIVHVTFCVLTVVFGGAKIRLWKHWEDSIAKDYYDTKQVFLFQAILWIRHQIRLHDTETWFYHDTLQGKPKVQFSQVYDSCPRR